MFRPGVHRHRTAQRKQLIQIELAPCLILGLWRLLRAYRFAPSFRNECFHRVHIRLAMPRCGWTPREGGEVSTLSPWVHAIFFTR